MIIRKISEGFSEKDAMNTENRTEQASIGTTGDMKDSVALAGNDNAVNSVEGNKIIGDHNKITIINPPIKDKTPTPEKTSFLIPNYIIVLALIGLSVWWFMQSTTLKPFEGNTYGIIVTTFKGNTEEQKNKGKEIQSSIQSTLNARFRELGINDAEARKDSTLIESHEAAREYGKKYKAELVIWGDVTIQGIIPNLTIVNEKSEASELMKPETSILKDSLCHAALAKINDIRFPELTDEPTRLVSFIAALKYYRQKNYDKAIAYFTLSISKESSKYIDSSVIFFYRGIAQYYKQEYDKAIDDCNQAISINPNFASAYNNRGEAYRNKGEYDKAIEDFSQAISINPNFALAYNNRGVVFWEKQEYDKAIDDCNQAISINPNLVLAYNNRGTAYSGKQEYDKAIDDYNQAIFINPKFVAAYTNRGAVYAETGEYDKAVEDYTQAIQIDSKSDKAYYNRGVRYGVNGKYDKAVADYTQAIQINRKYYKAYVNRGAIYAEKGEHDKAIEDYTQAIQINPKDYKAYNNRGVAYFYKGEYDKAIKDYTQSIQINPKMFFVYRSVSWLLATCPDEKYRNGQKAIEFAQKATELEPNNLIYRDTLAAAYAEAGKFDLAVKNQEKAIEMLNEKDKDKFLSEYTEHLNSYKANKPWREKPKSGIRE